MVGCMGGWMLKWMDGQRPIMAVNSMNEVID